MATTSDAQHTHSAWIWYPGDFEVWLGNSFNNRRTERGAMFPPFWKQDSHWPTVVFSKTITLMSDETITIATEGKLNLAIDGKLQYLKTLSEDHTCTSVTKYGITIPKGVHRIDIKVWNQAVPPSIYIIGETVMTDSSWLVTYEDKIWIDENGVAHGSGIYVPAASWIFDDMNQPPTRYQLERKRMEPICVTKTSNGQLYDFGRETMGYLVLDIEHVESKGIISVYYGESAEEAMDHEHCETLDRIEVSLPETIVCDQSKAFRFVSIEPSEGIAISHVAMDYEYTSFDSSKSGSFRCSDEALNRIWDVAAYTMDLTTREFFVDGIKRDRWTWSGDAIQSYLMNYYLRFDTECVKRTIRYLRGKDPVTAHINTIMDYTFYWFKSILDYYEYTADIEFIREMWPRMVTLMDYVLSRTKTDGMADSQYDTTGMIEGQPDDWIFVDWVDFPMHKHGVLCFEQILFCKALEVMARCAELLSSAVSNSFPVSCDTVAAKNYRERCNTVAAKTKQAFWSEKQHAYLHAIEDGTLNHQVTKFPNMFAILYGLADEEESRQIMESVMHNHDIPAITTPYMRFYELATLCQMGCHAEVLQEIRSYWGGMLHCGATSFWEKYVPTETGTKHLAMYGRPYGKSLCHAWGASPIYLLGRYFLGIRPTKPGYETYEVRPVLAGLDWMRGDVPTPFGKIHIEINRKEIIVYSDGGQGTLITDDKETIIPSGQELRILR